MLQSFIDILFPPSDDARLVRVADTDALIKQMEVRRFGNIEYLLPFREFLVRAAVHEAKFSNNRKAAALLGYVLNVYFADIPEDAVIIPVPLSKKRYRERGYNQVERIARIADVGGEVRDDMVARAKHSRPQTGLKREERLENLDQIFTVQKPEALYGKRIVLLDDVATTGTTLEKLREVVVPCRPKEVRCVAVAH